MRTNRNATRWTGKNPARLTGGGILMCTVCGALLFISSGCTIVCVNRPGPGNVEVWVDQPYKAIRSDISETEAGDVETGEMVTTGAEPQLELPLKL